VLLLDLSVWAAARRRRSVEKCTDFGLVQPFLLGGTGCYSGEASFCS
jgi:hypothetical protein